MPAEGSGMKKPFNFNALQVEHIIDKLVPLIAKQEDHEFFRGVLHCKADSCKSSAEFSLFVAKLLEQLA